MFLAAISAIAFVIGIPWTQCFLTGLVVLALKNRFQIRCVAIAHWEAVARIGRIEADQETSFEKHRQQLSRLQSQVAQVQETLCSHSAELQKINGVLSSVPEVQARSAVQDAVANVMKTGRS